MHKLASAIFAGRTVMGITLALVFSAPAFSQRQPIRRVQVYTIKSDRVDDFEAAAKQYVAIASKIPGGRAGVFQSLTGPRQYLVTRDYDNLAALDSGSVPKAAGANADLAKINLRIGGCVQSYTVLIEELRPQLSYPQRPAQPPQMIRIARSRVRPDKIAEFEAIIKNEMLPAMQKSGQTSYTVRRVRFGAPTNEYQVSTRINGWADLDKRDLAAVMGAEAFQRMTAKLTALTTVREVNVYRFRPDLSYGTGPNPAPATGQ